MEINRARLSIPEDTNGIVSSETQQAKVRRPNRASNKRFMAFSQASMTQLATSSRVGEGMKGFAKYMDERENQSRDRRRFAK